MEKRIKIKKYSKHPEMEGDKLEVTIMNSEKIKPRMKKQIIPRKSKQPRMTINQLAGIVGQQGTKLDQLAITVNQLAVTVNNLATEMRAGFVAVNHRVDKIDKEVGSIKEVLKRHEEILMRHEEKLK
jgi:methyl-accepting chemotaxis protein